ncbi:hypothetical protein [Marinomonas epiphytica]
MPTSKKGFDKWFDDLSPQELDTLWSDKKIRTQIERQIRNPGNLHEWCMVCRAPDFKEWGVSMDEIKRFRTKTADLKWKDPDTGISGGHGSTGSGKFHNELKDVIDNSSSLSNWGQSKIKSIP